MDGDTVVRYHGWIIIESGGKHFKDFVYVEFSQDGVRQRKSMNARGESGCAEAVEYWEQLLGQPISLLPTLRGCYRVYTTEPRKRPRKEDK